MRIARRNLLVSVMGLTLSIPLIKRYAVGGQGIGDLEDSFSALIDTFVPTDEYPGATDLGIDLELINLFQENKTYWHSISESLKAVNQLSRKLYSVNFQDGSLEQRTSILEILFASDSEHEKTKLQLRTLLNRTFGLFYTSQPAFDMLDYHPPSEGGYPDYDRSVPIDTSK